MLHYCINLSFALYSLQSQVRASLLQPAQTNNLWLLIRDLQRTSWKHKQWQGPGTAENPDSSWGWRLCHFGSCQLLQDDSSTTVIRLPVWCSDRQQGCTMCSGLSPYSCVRMKSKSEGCKNALLKNVGQAPTQWHAEHDSEWVRRDQRWNADNTGLNSQAGVACKVVF